MDQNQVEERLHAVETAQAAGAATLAGAQVTQAAAHAGMTATMTAMQAGTHGNDRSRWPGSDRRHLYRHRHPVRTLTAR